MNFISQFLINQLKESGKITDYNQLAFLFSSVKHSRVTALANFLEYFVSSHLEIDRAPGHHHPLHKCFHAHHRAERLLSEELVSAEQLISDNNPEISALGRILQAYQI